MATYTEPTYLAEFVLFYYLTKDLTIEAVPRNLIPSSGLHRGLTHTPLKVSFKESGNKAKGIAVLYSSLKAPSKSPRWMHRFPFPSAMDED